MDTRGRMLDAAAHVMRTKGLARATTKEIARESGFSEAALYKHFRDKTDLFLAVLRERAPGHLPELLAALAEQPGRGNLRANLLEVARTAIEFYTETFPMAASIFSEPALLAAHRGALTERGVGPQHVREALARYLANAKADGDLGPDADPEAAAALLLGACFMQAFLGNFTNEAGPSPEALVDALLTRQCA
ncbi:TetR/AcrR family transcriptional regulator [Sinomonas sp. JGH33]|uniref:TetR/AcrR family transcriptional regulator n=1 Tax=Sinomonas terricola TaxID=3110330 RepID=A0ABU5T387_9MICC|nr:TetR/AcrR family transcriptional regulator [Sinomonas sp. JGH33]MEA5454126.1 TetR/AcrR family transcriptional regulator [Sinomonas sp. JGH33]